MSAPEPALDSLSARLGKRGLTHFCATTLTSPRDLLEDSCERLGAWIRRGGFPGAAPVGIHLEGPFLNPEAAGAHPTSAIRSFDLRELRRLWSASRGSLRILTLAPEVLSGRELRGLASWASAKGVILQIGHTRATQTQAEVAFQNGFRGVTHAWNAMRFHHREPGALGAAIGRQGIHLELIADGVHLSPEVLRWTVRAHGASGVCLVSDCAPAAGCRPGIPQRFGDLTVRMERGACRLADGSLAGGALLLPQIRDRWKGLLPTHRLTGDNPWKLLTRGLGTG